MDLSIRPRQGVGNLDFGMERDQVRSLVGFHFKEFKKTTESLNTTDNFLRLNFHIYYDQSNRLVGLEFFKGSNPMLQGQSLIGCPYNDVLTFIRSIDVFTTEDGCYGFKAPNLGIKSFNSNLDKPATPLESIYVYMPEK